MPIQARTEFAAAINQIASEKGVDTDVILDAIQQAALAAYRKDLSFRNEPIPDDFEELTAELDPSSGEISILRGKENITPPGFARIAAQTAKQVITQKLHEAEKGAIVEEYDKKIGTVVSGSVQRQEGNTYFVDLGRAEGLLPPSEQVRDEYYGANQRMKFYIKEIRESGRGPEVIVSRTDPGLVKGLFAMEVPEIQAGSVEIKEIAREAGGRCKVAVSSNQDGVDPVGSMVGQKGVRVQAVINELGEEKIDIISYSPDIQRFIAAALSPAKDVQVTLNEEDKVAKVRIPDNQLSLAIGKGGQNVRLAAKLTGWKIDIEGTGENSEDNIFTRKTPTEATKEKSDSAKATPDEAGTDEKNEDVVKDQPADDTQQTTDDVSQNDSAKSEDQSSGESDKSDNAETQSPSTDAQDGTEGVADEAEFEKVEEEKIEKESEESKDSDESKEEKKPEETNE